MAAPSSLDAHLAEIDRRLRLIQTGLEGGETGLNGSETGFDGGETGVKRGGAGPVGGEPCLARAETGVERGAGSVPGITAAVSAGPFDGLEALARFERALSQLPGVRQVRLREYEGEDRAVYEVMLDPAIS